MSRSSNLTASLNSSGCESMGSCWIREDSIKTSSAVGGCRTVCNAKYHKNKQIVQLPRTKESVFCYLGISGDGRKTMFLRVNGSRRQPYVCRSNVQLQQVETWKVPCAITEAAMIFSRVRCRSTIPILYHDDKQMQQRRKPPVLSLLQMDTPTRIENPSRYTSNHFRICANKLALKNLRKHAVHSRIKFSVSEFERV